MEIVTMDNEVVKTMMEKIDRIADYVFKKDNVPKEEAEILLTSEEAADLLKISTRTLQRMRKDKTIPYMMARSKCRYRLTDLEECVRRKIVRCNPKTLEEFKHNYLMTRKEADDGSWKSHSTLTLLATQNYPFLLKYDCPLWLK